MALSKEDVSFAAELEDTISKEEHQDSFDMLFMEEDLTFLEGMISNGEYQASFDTVDEFFTEIPDLLQFKDEEEQQVSSMPVRVLQDEEDQVWTCHSQKNAEEHQVLFQEDLSISKEEDMLFTEEDLSLLDRMISNREYHTVDEIPHLLQLQDQDQDQDQEEQQVTVTVLQDEEDQVSSMPAPTIITVPSHPPDCEKEEDWTMAMPLGVKFRPTDVELINNYLKAEYVNGYIPRGIISTLDVYDYEPHQLPALGVDHGDGKYYFFTRVKKIGKSSYCERIIKSKIGFWKVTQSPRPIKDKNIKIGYKLSLTYYHNKTKTRWLMTEYRLESHSEHSSDYELVLAVVYYHHRRND